jgi:hypothetical protein
MRVLRLPSTTQFDLGDPWHPAVDGGEVTHDLPSYIRDTTVAEDASQIPPAPLGFDDRSGTRPDAAVDA